MVGPQNALYTGAKSPNRHKGVLLHSCFTKGIKGHSATSLFIFTVFNFPLALSSHLAIVCDEHMVHVSCMRIAKGKVRLRRGVGKRWQEQHVVTMSFRALMMNTALRQTRERLAIRGSRAYLHRLEDPVIGERVK